MRSGPTLLILAAVLAATAAAGAPPTGAAADDRPDEVVTASASARALNVTVGGERLTVGEVEAALDTGWEDLADPPEGAPPAAGCPGDAVACATGAAVAPPRGEAVTASAPGAPGPLESAAVALPEPLDGLLTLTGQSATAAARPLPRAGAEARSGSTTVDVTPARAAVGDLSGVRALLRGLGGLDEEGVGGRLADRLEGFVDDATRLAALRAEAGGSHAEALASPPSAVARGGVTTLVLAPLPGAESRDGLLIVEVSESEALAEVDDGTPRAGTTSPRVVVRVFNPLRGRYEERSLSPGPATACAGREPVRVCATGGLPRTSEAGRRASAAVSDLTLTLFDEPLPQVVVELGGVEAEIVSAPAGGGVPDEAAIAAVLALAAAGAIVAGLVLARRREGAAPEA